MAKGPGPKGFYTTAQAAQLLGVTAPTVINWIGRGKIAAATTPGGHRRIAVDEIAKLLNEREVDVSAVVSSAPRKRRVLILDTELDFADTVAEYLTLKGEFDSRSAVEPLEIGFALGDFRPDIVLCSLDLPVFNAVVSRVQGIDADCVLLANGPVRLPLRDGLEGCTVIEKPVQLETVLRVIRDL